MKGQFPLILRTLRLGLSLLATILLLFGLPVFLAAITWVILAETTAARIMALFFIAMYSGMYFFRKSIYGFQKKGLRTALISSLISGLFLGVALMLSPPGKTGANAFQSVFRGSHEYDRFSLFNLVPEIDQVKVGIYLSPMLDPAMTTGRAKNVFRSSMDVYRELERDEGFRESGSVMREVYSDIVAPLKGPYHLYSYIPKAKGKIPVILFLHGSMGNFKGHLWVWKEIADKQGMAIIAPSFGAGIWSRTEGKSIIDDAHNFISSHPGLDASRIILAGLSNGGLGVTRELESERKYAGVIYVSGVLEPDRMLSDNFRRIIAGTPMLFFFGNEDERFPRNVFEKVAGTIQSERKDVAVHQFEREDHFLFYSKRHEVAGIIAKFVEDLSAARE